MTGKMVLATQLPSLLIAGGHKQAREEKVEEIIGQSLISAAKTPDYLLLSSTPNIGIEEVRNLQRFLQFKPFQEKQKIALIQESQNLTLEAQNALLKTLEEPPSHSLIILTAPNASLLLPTIVSRCAVIQLSQAAPAILADKEMTAISQSLTKLLTASVGERLTLGESLNLYKDRESSLTWLDKLTLVTRQQMLTASKKGKGQLTWLSLLKAINRAKRYLRANCNVRLTMEVFLSEISHLF
ncbi:MAG TPA: hypothetical protein VMW04_00385 [Patescibacteria group bacterium]|nr:hypothetical protein [Patescibacteria group bacterium]